MPIPDWSRQNATRAADTNDPRVTSVGTPLTVSATTNLNVGPTPYFIQIYDETTGTRLASCGTGTTCTGQFQPPACGSPDRLVAFVASSSSTFLPPNIQAASVVDWACTQPPG